MWSRNTVWSIVDFRVSCAIISATDDLQEVADTMIVRHPYNDDEHMKVAHEATKHGLYASIVTVKMAISTNQIR